MRKVKVKVGGQTFQIAKNYSNSAGDSKGDKREIYYGSTSKSYDDLNSILEEEILGDNESRRSDVKEKNLNQMITGLHSRLSALQDAAKIRKTLLGEDLNEHSTRCYEQCPKLADDSDEIIPKSLWQKKTKETKLYHKGDPNLVSTEGIYIDSRHLVIKTKLVTERGKKLETSLEDYFGVSNIRDANGKKTKTLKKAEKSKLSEQQKSEVKRIIRSKLEKILQSDVEYFVTRSVADEAVLFKAPPSASSSSQVVDFNHLWPIPIRWPNRDPRSKTMETSDGMMSPDILLKYAITRIHLPNGENYFRNFVKQPIVQDYFIALFWCIKVKFFQHDEKSQLQDEEFLLHLLSESYIQIINLLSERAKEEHEKDLTFKFLPFILSNAVFYAFFFLIPASRHLYSKGFRKTIYLQVIQIMFGLQLCPISIRSTWNKLFPEDHDDEEMEGEGGEMFPIPIALVGAKKEAERKKLEQIEKYEQLKENFLRETMKGQNGSTTSATSNNVNNMSSIQINNSIRPSQSMILKSSQALLPLSSSSSSSSNLSTSNSTSLPKEKEKEKKKIKFEDMFGSRDRTEEEEQQILSQLDNNYGGGGGGGGRGGGFSSFNSTAGGDVELDPHLMGYHPSKKNHHHHNVNQSAHNNNNNNNNNHKMNSNPHSNSNLIQSKNKIDWIRFQERALTRGGKYAQNDDEDLNENDNEYDQDDELVETIYSSAQLFDPYNNNSNNNDRKKTPIQESTKSSKNAIAGNDLNYSPPPSLLQMAKSSSSSTLASSTHSLPNTPHPQNRHSPPPSNSQTLTQQQQLSQQFSPNLFKPPRSPVGIGGKEFAIDIMGRLPHRNPLIRTNLQPQAEMPSSTEKRYPRQNVEPLNIRGVSPLVQDFFIHQEVSSSSSSSSSNSLTNHNRAKEHVKRTLPAPWCFVGGSDTYHKRNIPRELHDELSMQKEDLKKDFIREAILQHKLKIKALQKLETTCESILASGQQKVSRFSLDIIRRQREPKKERKDKSASTSTSTSEKNMKGLNLMSLHEEDEVEDGEEHDRPGTASSANGYDDEEMDKYIESL